MTPIQINQNINLTFYNLQAKSERHREVMIKAYDKFRIQLSNMQLLFGSSFDECMKAREDASSPCHILRPTGLDINLHMSSIDDLQIPKLRVYGDLPDVVVRMSDERALQLARLAFSIPTPKSEDSAVNQVNLAPPVETGKVESKFNQDRAKMHAIMEVDEVDEELIKRHVREETAAQDEETFLEGEPDEEENQGAKNKELREQMVQVDLNLRLNQIGLEIYRADELVLAANIRQLGFQLQMRTFDMVVRSHLGSITVEMPKYKSLLPNRDILYLIDNPGAESDEHLMEMLFVQANKESPFFVTEYKKIQQNIEFKFKTLNITLHQEALMHLKSFGEKLSEQLKQVQEKNPERTEEFADAGRKISRKLSGLSLSSLASGASEQTREKRKRTKRQKTKEELFDESVINLKLNAHVTSLQLLIGSSKGSDTSLDISGTKCSVTMRQKETQVQATLDSIQMLDETPNATHRKLLAVTSKDNQAMFQLDFRQQIRSDSERRHMEIQENDMSVRIRLAQLRFVFLNLWVSRMLHWINPFQEEAVAAATQAQQLASEKAAETAQTVKKMLEENPQRILLDVELYAPAIVVPRRSNSNQVLLFNLGRLIVNNKFSSMKGAIVDNMTVALNDVHASTGLLSKDSVSVSTQCNILKPLTFNLELYRNLSFQLHKDVPELALNAHLSYLDLSLSQQDYAVIMQTLSGNLAEGKPPPAKRPAPTSAKTEQPTDTIDMRKPSRSQRLLSTVSPPTLAGAMSAPPVMVGRSGDDGGLSMDRKRADYQRIVFNFQMDEIDMRLYEGDTGLDDGKGLIERTDNLLFGQMKVTQLKVAGWMTEKGAIDTGISLLSFTMDDKREGKTKVPHLMDKRTEKADELLLDLKYKQDSDGNQNVDIHSRSLFLCLCPEFLGALAAFFTVPKSEEDQKLEEAALAIKTSKLGTVGGASGQAVTAKSGQVTCKLFFYYVFHRQNTLTADAALKPPTTLTFAWPNQ
ncbi:hypothetical protein M3Y97_01056900 [Aphelenchoides bicaudatus]|nr:hypothetical protein M3Y97_01056900 [Aphelenchoides bicaudatus]